MRETTLPLLAWITLTVLTLTLAATNTTTNSTADTFNILKTPIITKPNCPSKCGDLTVPYPFGIGAGCGIGNWFEFNCSDAFDPPRAFIGTIRVYEISDNQMRVSNVVSRRGKNIFLGPQHRNSASSSTAGTPYSYSELNRFNVIGCDDFALITGIGERSFTSGCVSLCSKAEDVIGGYCSGCRNYAFLGEHDKFVFRGASDLSDPNFMQRVLDTVPIVVDWAIGNMSCAEVVKSGDYACKGNSFCIDSDTGMGGYQCNYNKGYGGNPYLDPGCTDIDEYAESNQNDCEKLCINTPGSYNCSCPDGQSGDGRKHGRGCNAINSQFPVIKVALGIGFGFLSLVIVVTWLYFSLKKRKLTKHREKFFQQNGGLLLKQQISSNEGPTDSTKIFTAEELGKATGNYADELTSVEMFSPTCEALQRQNQDIFNALRLVASTKLLLQKMKDESWNDLLSVVKSFCQVCNINIPDLSSSYRSRGPRARNEQSDHTLEHHYRVDIFYEAINCQLMELYHRFSDSAMELFYPEDFSDHEKTILKMQLQHYDIDVVQHADYKKLTSIAELGQWLVRTRREITFDLIYRVINLLLTLPVSTATTERSFSAMNIVKTRIRNKMEDEFLNDSLILHIERELAEKITLDEIIEDFKAAKDRRVPL
ncbi:hypothetical protein OROHE_013379 [Orobanche hederae]